MRVLMETDIREVLPAISVPTLMMYNARYRDACVQMAERIPNAELVELFAPDISTYADPRVGEEVRALPGRGPRGLRSGAGAHDRAVHRHRRFHPRASELGDRRWRELLGAHHADRSGPDRALRRQGGPRHGDGFFATFEGPARAIAARARRVDGVGGFGLEVRAGVHTGEVEIVGGRMEGIAVHIGARIAADAGPCEVLVRVSCATLPPAPGSTSRIGERTSSRAFPGDGGCLRLD